MPVIRGKIRSAILKGYSKAVPWQGTNTAQHAAFQCMWAKYDHVLPHARVGSSNLDNVYLTCAACNYGRRNYLLEKFDLVHPRLHARREENGTDLRVFVHGDRHVNQAVLPPPPATDDERRHTRRFGSINIFENRSGADGGTHTAKFNNTLR